MGVLQLYPHKSIKGTKFSFTLGFLSQWGLQRGHPRSRGTKLWTQLSCGLVKILDGVRYFYQLCLIADRKALKRKVQQRHKGLGLLCECVALKVFSIFVSLFYAHRSWWVAPVEFSECWAGTEWPLFLRGPISPAGNSMSSCTDHGRSDTWQWTQLRSHLLC